MFMRSPADADNISPFFHPFGSRILDEFCSPHVFDLLVILAHLGILIYIG